MNSCYTYFAIVGEFDPDAVTRLFGLYPFETHHKGEDRVNGDGWYSNSIWSFGKCDKYSVNVNEQIRRTIAPLLGKLDVLKHIKDNFEVDFYIEVVPEIYAGEPAPILGPELDIIDFCHAARASVDIDLYLLEAESRE